MTSETHTTDRLAASVAAHGAGVAAPAPLGKLLYVVTEDWYFLSHRLGLAKAAKAAGYDVTVATAPGQRRDEIEAAGLAWRPWKLVRRSMNPLAELSTLRDLRRIVREDKPVLVHLVALKPVLYGALAIPRKGPRIVASVAGMGYVFLGGGVKRRLLQAGVRTAYRWLLRGRPHCKVIVQNPDDAATLIDAKMIWPDQVTQVRGSGVDLARFAPQPEPPLPLVVLLHGRMLWDKGIGELVEAVRTLRERGLAIRLVLVGIPDEQNPASIEPAQLARWQEEGLIEWLGRRRDIPELIAASHIVCLPSYREGAPLALIEACAAGRAVITTDVPGCRHVIADGDNGLLVPPRDAAALADAIAKIAADPALRARLAGRGRERAVAEFDERIIYRQTLDVYRSVLQPA